MKCGYINATLDGRKETAFLTEDGIFAKFGTNTEIEAEVTAEDELVDLKGSYVVPGFCDSHMHLLETGAYLNQVMLMDCHSLGAIKSRIEQALSENREWIIGRGFLEENLAEKKLPDRAFLDAITIEHPIALTRGDGHLMCVNSKAMEYAGILPGMVVDGGSIDFANGILLENAIELIHQAEPPVDENTIKKYILDGAAYLNRFGITSVGSDDFVSLGSDYRPVLNVYEQLSYQEKLNVRVTEQCEFPSHEELANFLDDGYTYDVGNDYFRIGPLKLIADGSLGAHTAYMKDAYLDEPQTKGQLVTSEEEMEIRILLANRFNMPTIAHCIGDAALDTVLRLYDEVLLPGNPLRYGIVHCQIMRPDQIKAVTDRKLDCYFQSSFIADDANILYGRVNKELADSSYPYRSLYTGTIACNGSDSPVTSPNVLRGMSLAMTRNNGTSQLKTSECLSYQQALDSYTLAGQKAMELADRRGRLAEGMDADFTVLSEDLRTMRPEEFTQAKILYTVLNGRTVFER